MFETSRRQEKKPTNCFMPSPLAMYPKLATCPTTTEHTYVDSQINRVLLTNQRR